MFCDKIAVSLTGAVKMVKEFWDQNYHKDKCVEWAGARFAKGYGMMGRRRDGKFKLFYVHRFVLASWQGVDPWSLDSKSLALHICDNPPCFNPLHLFWGTQKDNMEDMKVKKRDRKAKGAEHGLSKLTAAKVRNIRVRLAAGETQQAIAQDYGVTYICIGNIKSGRTWAWLK